MRTRASTGTGGPLAACDGEADADGSGLDGLVCAAMRRLMRCRARTTADGDAPEAIVDGLFRSLGFARGAVWQVETGQTRALYSYPRTASPGTGAADEPDLPGLDALAAGAGVVTCDSEEETRWIVPASGTEADAAGLVLVVAARGEAARRAAWGERDLRFLSDALCGFFEHACK